MYLGGDESLTSRDWIETNIRREHGALGVLYPTRTWTAPNPHSALKEGDTPSWFYFLPNGINEPERPDWGGWGGRFRNVKDRRYRDAVDTVGAVTDARSTVWRWRDAFQRDFQARMDWCVKRPAQANHAPIAVCNRDRGMSAVRLRATPGDTMKLDAVESRDPDGHALTFRWWVYPEAGTCTAQVTIRGSATRQADVLIPAEASGSELHLVLEVTDNGQPSLTSYRRVVVAVD
jgi:hypothetical protein